MIIILIETEEIIIYLFEYNIIFYFPEKTVLFLLRIISCYTLTNNLFSISINVTFLDTTPLKIFIFIL